MTVVTDESMAWDLKHNREYALALSYFDKAILKKEKLYQSLHGKGECLLELKQYDEALECFMRAMNIDRFHHWAYHGIGRVYFFLKDYDKAIEYFDKSIELNSKTVIAYYYKGLIYYLKDDLFYAHELLSFALSNCDLYNRKEYEGEILQLLDEVVKSINNPIS